MVSIREPRTYRALRQAAVKESCRDVMTRHPNRRKYIPTSWDDNESSRDRSWKKYRHTKYKCFNAMKGVVE